jgi:hypothetical protein
MGKPLTLTEEERNSGMDGNDGIHGKQVDMETRESAKTTESTESGMLKTAWLI